MKNLIGLSILLILLGACSQEAKAPLDVAPRYSSANERLLLRYAARHKASPEMIEHLREVVTQVEAYAGLLCIDDQVDTILSMIKAESDFRPHVVGDDGRSHGIGQTLKEDFSRWRKFWRKRGVELGSFYELETQIAFCVAEFYDKLYQAQPKGSVWSAVRRYNGWDRRSLRYLKRVKQFRGKIFHRPDTGDEFVILIPCEAIRD